MELDSKSKLCRENIALEADKYGNIQNKKWASVGFMAIMEFEPCYITGFDCFSSSTHHYFKDEVKNSFHDTEIESEFVKSKIRDGKIFIL